MCKSEKFVKVIMFYRLKEFYLNWFILLLILKIV